MPDVRSRADKLRAMAKQTDSPHEAALARDRLRAMGESLEEPSVQIVPDEAPVIVSPYSAHSLGADWMEDPLVQKVMRERGIGADVRRGRVRVHVPSPFGE